MASSYFSIEPSSGSGSGRTYIEAQENDTYLDRSATATITNGVVTRTVSITQYGMPNFVLESGSTNIPYTGGTTTYRLTSHYRFKFRNRPSWITITGGGNTYSSDTWYNPASTNYVITMTIYPATSIYEQRATNFDIYFDAGNGSSFSLPFVLEGIPQEVPYLEVVPNRIVIDWNDLDAGTGKYFSVNTNQSDYTATPSQGSDSYFDFLKLGGTYSIMALNNNTTSAKYEASVVFSATDCPSLTRSVYQYHRPSMTGVTTNISGIGEIRTITVNSNNDWYISGIPNYVTVRKNGNTVDLTQRQTGGDSSQSYTFTWAANDGNQRSCTIVLHYYTAIGDTDSTTDSLSFTQEEDTATVSFVFNPTTIAAAGGTVTATITSTYGWQFDTLSAPFNGQIYDSNNNRIYPLQEQAGVTNATYTFGVSANNTSQPIQFRARIVYKASASAQSFSGSLYSNYITEQPTTVTVQPSYIDFSFEDYQTSGEAQLFSITSNRPFTLSAPSWIDITPSSGSQGSTTIRATANSSNTGSEDRSGEIQVLVGGNVITSVYVTQYCENPVVEEWIVDPMLAQLDSSSQQNTFDLIPPDESYDWVLQVDGDSLDWLAIDSNDFGTGSAVIEYSVNANTTGSTRYGRIDVLQPAASEDEVDVVVASFEVEQGTQ